MVSFENWSPNVSVTIILYINISEGLLLLCLFITHRYHTPSEDTRLLYDTLLLLHPFGILTAPVLIVFWVGRILFKNSWYETNSYGLEAPWGWVNDDNVHFWVSFSIKDVLTLSLKLESRTFYFFQVSFSFSTHLSPCFALFLSFFSQAPCCSACVAFALSVGLQG